MTRPRVFLSVLLVIAAVFAVMPSPSRADCVQEVYAADPPSTNPFVFPNWYRAPVAALWIWECMDVDPYCMQTACAAGSIRGVTIVNFGTAMGGPGSDITGLSFQLSCVSTTALQNMTYAGVWGGKAAWTWAGALAMPVDPCDTKSGCWCWPQMFFYTDIGPCPTDGATIELGPGFDSLSTVKGGITDTCNCSGPQFGDAITEPRTIKYVVKQADQSTAIPGDTMTFSIYYGKPGGAAISPIIITDTVPSYTHYVFGSGNPPPDSGWDPSATTPQKLRWTLPGPFTPTGGATSLITFQLTVDWGNGDSFEPGSGDAAAPEGYRVVNTAHATFTGAACPVAVSNQAQTTIKRFLMWVIGDNDVLFSPSFGQPPDEMIYEVFIKNVSTTKTWYDVRIWDTIPASLDVWQADCGFDDPCAGWTMTPTGCAAATPGKILSGTNTVMTWKLDMPPQFTLGLRFKAKVKGTANAGDTAINVMSVRAFGHTLIVDGTGDSTAVKNFAHLAPIILPTTYISYVGYSGMQWAAPGEAVIMFPLNKKTQFELRALSYDATGWALVQGVSDSIGCLLGNCLGGFPGNLGACPGAGSMQAPNADTWGGCKAERIPARYSHAVPTADPYQHVYKITSNSPVDWQAQPYIGSNCGDFITYAPSTTLTYTGLMHYFWKNGYLVDNGNLPTHGTEMWFQNTNKDPYGNVVADLSTTLHMFQFDFNTNSWVYIKTYEIGSESGAMDSGTFNSNGTGAWALREVGAYRSVSSVGQMIVWQGYASNSRLGSGCPYYDASAMMPTRDTGICVGYAGDVFYGEVHGYSEAKKCVIQNVGATDCVYRVWQYKPDETVGPVQIPPTMFGTSGTWKPKGTFTVAAGFTNAGNPDIYALQGAAFDSGGNTIAKVEVLSGGPIQIFSGSRVFVDWGGGGTVHSIYGTQTGSEFWFGFTNVTDGSGPTHVYRVNLYCPKTGTAVRCDSETGTSGTYTTTGPDQVIAFGPYAAGDCTPKKNYRYYRTSATGDIICQWFNDGPEKGFTAPFLQTGVHYSIIMPPTVFVGQSFWITMVVLEQGGATKCDYGGTASFTSSDPGAKIQGVGMESYNYTYAAGAGGDCGVKVFINVSFTQLGLQSIIAVDTTDGSISGVTATMVVGADVKLEKMNKLSVAASGDTVAFRICWSNYSTATAMTFVITDAVPNGTTYVPEVASLALCGWNGPNQPTVTLATSTSTATTPAAVSFATLGPGSSAASTTRWLRWTVRDIYVFSSGCVCFKVSVE